MEKYLYFAVGANDAYTYPSSRLTGFEVDNNGKLNIYFKPLVDAGQDTTADEVDKIILSVGGTEKDSAKAIVEAISATGSMKEAFITIADSEAGVFLANSGITACDSVTLAG
tara:strand:+ start:328 stop:663 length:336 start_codon:yes stop_codon:yes gene_type:complete